MHIKDLLLTCFLFALLFLKIKLSKYPGVNGVVQYAIRTGKEPVIFTDCDLDAYCQELLKRGKHYSYIRALKSQFRRFVAENNLTERFPGIVLSLRRNGYGIALDKLPPVLRTHIEALLTWKQAPYAYGRPAKARVRAVTAKRLESFLCRLAGFVINVLKRNDTTTLAELVTEENMTAFTEWLINERKLNGAALISDLRLLYAAMRSFPAFKKLDLRWFPELIGTIEVEPETAIYERKMKKWLSYDDLEKIAEKIDEECKKAEKLGGKALAWLNHHALLYRCLLVLAWRQRNLREARIEGSKPNLFKAEIPPLAKMTIPPRVKKERTANSHKEFWQIHFREDETKTGHEVRGFVPLRLIVQLEEYIHVYRPQLIRAIDPPHTLFLNSSGGPLTQQEFSALIADLTARYGGRPVTPHLHRDIFAVAWLDAHPENYLTLQKALWHRDIKTTLRIYGRGIDESHALSRVEEWLDQRDAKSSQQKEKENEPKGTSSQAKKKAA